MLNFLRLYSRNIVLLLFAVTGVLMGFFATEMLLANSHLQEIRLTGVDWMVTLALVTGIFSATPIAIPKAVAGSTEDGWDCIRVTTITIALVAIFTLPVGTDCSPPWAVYWLTSVPLCIAFVALPRRAYWKFRKLPISFKSLISAKRWEFTVSSPRLSLVMAAIRTPMNPVSKKRRSRWIPFRQRLWRLADAFQAPLIPEIAYPSIDKAPTTGKASAWIISLTPVTDEPRVIRQAAMLHQAGWDVVIVGYRGKSRKPHYWNLLEVVHGTETDGRWKGLLRRMALRASAVSSTLAGYYYWNSAGYGHIYWSIANALAAPSDLGCDLVVAHDYYTAPLAARIARRNDIEFAVDCHEYATGQYMHDPHWRRTVRPWVHAMQKRFLPRAAVVTTVCDGIARLLDSEYALRSPVKVVRSTPTFVEAPFRPTGASIDVLYHGILDPVRGLDVAIESVPYWRPEFRLVIRGPGPSEYIEALRRLARERGVQSRVAIEPPVLFGEMISAANRADIGYFVHEDISPQKRFVLPNKLFEYIMAGLAICVSDLPEMAKIVRGYDLGRLVAGTSPQAIAEVINSFDRSEIDRCKMRSISAARELCWENESRAMQAAYDELLHV